MPTPFELRVLGAYRIVVSLVEPLNTVWDYSFKNEKKKKMFLQNDTNKSSEDTYEDVYASQKLNEFEQQPCYSP